MSKLKRLLSVLVAIFMLLTMPITTGISRAIAEGTTDQADSENPSESIALEMEEMDPAKLHVHKLGEVDEEEDNGFDPAELEIIDLNKIVRASIFLDGRSTIDMGYDTQNIADNSSATAYRNKLRQQQKTMQAKIEAEVGHELTVKWNLTLLANAISVEIPYKDVATIRGLEGVKSVELETQYEAPRDAEADHPNTANTSENMVGAQYAWNTLGYTGAGSKVAIIDTGLDTAHQSVNEDAFNHAIDLVRADGKTVDLMTSIPSSGLNASNPTRISAKIPYAYNYVDGGTRVNHQDSQSNHGSHVAGIAAANRFIKNGSSYVDAASTVGAVGMAPDAQILVMKVFGTNGGAYDSDYFAAIEDAVVLGADACNLSLGSGAPGFTYASTSYQAILNGLVGNTINNHMVLSISAGNAYSADSFTSHKLYAEDASFHTGGSPGSFVNSMGVAAAQNTKTTGTPLTFNSSTQVFYNESTEDSDGNAYTNPEMTTVAGSYSYVYIDAIGETSDFQTVNAAESLSGKIVIINRGSLSFSEKGNNASSYNPKAMICANNAEGTILMNLSDFTGTFPYVTISLKDANAIKEGGTAHTAGGITYYTGSATVTTTEVSTVAAREDAEVTDFSSWGVPGSLLMKPEITAPGGDIYSINGTSSSDSGSGTDQYISYSGTSMAAPHITGLSAVLMQYLKEKTPENADLMSAYNLRAIANSLLMSTATPMINSNAFVSILQQGAGLVEVSKAIEAKSVIMMDEAYLTSDTNAAADGKVKVELGDDPQKAGSYTYKFTIYNLSDKTLEYELGTVLFTQKVSGDTLVHTTTTLPLGGDTYEWDGVAPAEEHDVDKDGDTDDDDAQAILDLVSGEIEMDDPDYDFDVADLDGDEMITSYDAYLLLNRAESEGPSGYVVGPHDKAQVTVHINLTDNQKAALEKEGGAWLEGFTYVDCITVTNEDEDLSHEHTIPILGYYGSWTDPSMFDTNSYTEALYGNEQENYSGNAATGTNYMRISTEGTLTKFSGNPYKVEDNGEFPADRLAIRSDSIIKDIAYNLIRNAGGTGYAVTKVDEDGNVTDIVASTVLGQEVEGLWYYVNGGSWQNTMTKVYSINKTPSEYGFSEGEKFRVGFYAIPEYNAMKHSDDMTAADAGTLTSAKFNEMLTSGELGKGAYVGFDFVVDDTAPEVTAATLTGNTLSITASDDRALAYVGVLSLDGTVTYAEVTPGTDTYTVSFDATDAIANANGYVAAFAGDYAGNEAAMAVKVNENGYAMKTVYVLTNTVEAGQEYLIMSRNSAGTGYGLYYTLNTSGTTATAGAYSATVKAGISGTNNQPYIESSDAASTGIWKAGTGSTSGTFTFNNNDWYIRYSNSNNLTITKDSSRRDWNWDSTNNRLSYTTGSFITTTRYLRYNNGYSVNTTASSVYMYVKSEILSDTPIDPYAVTSVKVTPSSVEIYKGDTANLTAKVMPLTASPRTVTWSSSNTSVATVDEFGTVTGIAAGTATIRATSVADNTKYGECAVTVVAINKSLNAAIWDEEGNVFFSSFNSNNLPNWTKSHNTGTGVYVTSAMMGSTTALYAATNDLSSSIIYTVNRSSYAMTEVGDNYVVPFGMATVGTSFGGTSYYVYAFAKYLIFGNLEPAHEDSNDDTSPLYCGLPYGLLDLSTTDVGDAYAVAICCRSKSTTSATYYFLDETGKIWQTSQSYSQSSGISFSSPTLVYDTGISAGLQYNSIYYDGTNLFWSHQDGDYATLYIYVTSTGKFYRAGNFGEKVWPAAGLYRDGSLAPASVEPGDEIMSEELVGELNLKPLMSREELMTPEIMERFEAEAEKYNTKIVYEEEVIDDEPIELPEMANDPEEPDEEPTDAIEEPVEELVEEPAEEPAVIDDEPIELPELPIEEPTEEPEEPAEEPEEPEETEEGEGAPRAITGTPNSGTIPFAESEASTNGYFTVGFDPDVLTYVSSAKGTADNLFVSIHVDDKGVISVSYAMKGETPLAAETTIATATFTAGTCADTELEVITLERGEEVELDEDETITITGTGHDWAAPTYEWAQEGEDWTCTATRICNNNSDHVETEKVTATAVTTEPTCTETGSIVYTATFENEAFETQTKTVEIEALGHAWGEPTYVWAEDNSTVTATRVCANDSTHTETEAVNTTYAVTTEPTYEAPGVGTYTATFENTAFATQTKEVEIPMLVHDMITITLEPCNEGESETITIEIPIDGTIAEFPTVAYQWHKLIGWFADSRTGLETGTGTQITTETVFTEDTTIYANWYLPGDVNGDGKVNDKDVNRLSNYVDDDDVEVVLYACDVNGDGKINDKDVNRLSNYVDEDDVEIF